MLCLKHSLLLKGTLQRLLISKVEERGVILRRGLGSERKGIKVLNKRPSGLEHSEEVISMIVGSVLGDSHLEKRKNGRGTRLKLEQCGKNVEYLMWFHNKLASEGYCRKEKPKLKKRIREGGVYYHYQINSYTFESLNWLYELFYKEEEGRMRKVVFKGIERYLTPEALAVWFQEDGSRTKETVRIATNNLKEEEIRYLCEVLKEKYGIIASVMKGGKGRGWVLYIYKESRNEFVKLVKPYMRRTMYYKLGEP